jgi:hypothetical protein
VNARSPKCAGGGTCPISPHIVPGSLGSVSKWVLLRTDFASLFAQAHPCLVAEELIKLT